MPYDIDLIHSTNVRLFKIKMSQAEYQLELDRPVWIPEIDRMIAVADALADLPDSSRYGLFQGMSGKGEYQIASGRYSYSRALTAEEIAKCF